MGLFDSLQFSPQTYGGQGGGLLDLLRMFQSVPTQQPAGFPAMNNEPSPLDTAQWPQGPVGAPSAQLPPSAQPTQGQMPMAPDFGSRLSAGLEGLTSGPGLISKFAGLASGLATGQSPTNQTQQALIQRGLDPVIAKQVAQNPDLMRAVLPHIMGLTGQTDDIKEYQFAKKEDPSLTFERFMARKKSVTGEYGMQPIYGTDEKGNTVVLQLGKSGDAKQSVLPPGVKLSTGVEKIDLGTHWGIIDKKTGNMVGQQRKDIVGKESEEEVGKDQGIARAALPAAEISAKRSLEKIDQFLKHEGFSEVFGPLDQFRPNWTMSDKGRDALARFKQLSGEAFLEGRQMLKGGGAITDFESNKAEAAIVRLERSLSEDDAKAALRDFRDAVNSGLEKLRARAGNGPAPTTAPATAPRIRLNADGTIKQ